LVAFPQKR